MIIGLSLSLSLVNLIRQCAEPRTDDLLITFSRWNGRLKADFLPKIDIKNAEMFKI